MEPFSKHHIAVNSRCLFLFSLAWVGLNLLQAATVPIDPDEAYYWLYSHKLQWGYFDHPPLVALAIRLGETLGHGPFYTRLVAVLLSAGTVYVGFKVLPEYLSDVKLYLLLFCSATLFHVYSFISTPDALLLFFTVVFFYSYRRYLEKDTVPNTVLLSLSIAGLLYSKYQGILPVFFTLLSNPALLKKRSAWGLVLLVAILLSPHLWWQYNHNWPTFRYHLYERIASPYALSKTTYFIAGQLFIWGPLLTIPALILFYKTRRTYSRYEWAHLFTFWGVLLFFLFSSFRTTIQPYWTLVAGPSFLVLLLGVLYHAPVKQVARFKTLAVVTLLLLLAGRVLFMIPVLPVKGIKAFDDLMDAPTWTASLYRFAQGKPVVFVDTYRLPVLYQYYYPDAKSWGYNTVVYRKTQYNLYNDSSLNNKLVYIAGTKCLPGTTNVLKTAYDTFCIQPLNGYRSVSNIHVKWLQPVTTLRHSGKNTVAFSLYNAGLDTIAASGLTLNYTFLKTRSQQFIPPINHPLQERLLLPGYKKTLFLDLKLPMEPGTYSLVFSIVQPPLAGTFASPFYSVVVE